MIRTGISWRKVTLCLLVLFTGIYWRPAEAQQGRDARVEAILQAMPLDQRVGQLFMVSVYGTTLTQSTQDFLQKMTPGAIVLFNSNAALPDQVTQMVDDWQAIATQVGAKVPLIIAVDHEGGTVVRLTEGFTPLPWGAALGAMPTEDAQEVGAIAAQELRAVGVNMNLAPVADVRVPADPPLFMDRRSFGPDPVAVGKAVSAYLRGLQSNRVIGALKHFPGHGSAGDSHQYLPLVTHSLDELNRIDLPPFEEGIQNGANVVMVGHLSVPALESTPGLPASLSPRIIGDVLRKQLGFDGVVMTDAMDMGAIVDNFTEPRSAVMAIQAGADVIAEGPSLSINDQLAMKQAIIDAVGSGTISAAQIEESARRVLMLKAKYGLLDWSPLDPATAAERVNMAAHQAMLESIYLDTVAISYDFMGFLPLKPGEKKVAVVFPGVYPGVERECSAISPGDKALAYSLSPTNAEMIAVRQLARDADVVVIFTYNINDYPRQAQLVNSVPSEKSVVIALQSPYDFEWGIRPGAYMVAFNPYPPAFRAACAVLYGQHRAVGSFQVISG